MMTERADTKSFVIRSTYRLQVVRSLAQSGQLTPTSIAQRTDIRQPHVSRAISELQEHDVVFLVVSENQQKGRLYELTHLGMDIWSELRSVNWLGPTDSIPESHRELMVFLQDKLGDQLIAAGSYNGSEINNYYMQNMDKREFSEEKFASTVESIVEARTGTDIPPSEIAGELKCEIQSFTGFHRIVIYTAEGIFGFALEPDCYFEFPTLVEACMDTLE